MNSGDESIVRVNHEELKDLIKVCVETQKPLFVWGAVGIGKSQTFRDITKEMDIGFIDMRLSLNQDPSDIRGLPNFEKDENGNVKSTLWVTPKVFPKEGKGILFLDELNLAPASIQASAMSLTLDRRIGEYKLPDGWVVFAAGNRLEDRANVFEIPAPLRNRLLQVELVSDKQKTIDFMTEKGIHPDIASFLMWKPEYLHTFKDNPDASVFATPRTWNDYVDRIIRTVENLKMELKAYMIGSAVGNGIAREFISFRKLHNKIDLNELLNNPKKVKEITKIDEQYCLVSALASKYTSNRKLLTKVLDVCNNFQDAEFGILLARLLKNGNKYFKADFKQLARKKDNIVKTFIEKYMKYIVDEDIRDL